jgi:hypothetical protein
MTAYHPLSILKPDLWGYSLSFIDKDELLQTISHLEDAFPSQHDLMECTNRLWTHSMEEDQAQINTQWKTHDGGASPRCIGRDVLQAKR